MFSIVISEKGGAERRETYDRSEINVGRVQGNDLMLPKGNVSKRHARLLFRDGRFIVTDLKSTNGTYVNGRKIAQATIVREGDKIYIGDFVLRIESADGSQAPANAPSSPQAGGAPPENQSYAGPSAQPPPFADDSSSEGEAPKAPAPAAPAAAPAPPAPAFAPPGPAAPPPMPQPAAPPAAPRPAPPMGPQVAPQPIRPTSPPAAPAMAPAPPAIVAQPPAMVQSPQGPPPMPPAGAPPQAPPQGASPSNFPQPPANFAGPPNYAGGGAPGGGQPYPAQPAYAGAAAGQGQYAPPAYSANPVIPQPPALPQQMPPGGYPAPPAPSVPPAAAPPAVVPSTPAAPEQPPTIGAPPPQRSQAPVALRPAGAALPSAAPPGSSAVPSSGQGVPSPMPSSKRVDMPPVDASQAAIHRSLLGKLVERALSAIDPNTLQSDALDSTRTAQIDRVLRERVASLAAEIPPPLTADVLVAEAKRELCELGPIGPLLDDEDVEEVQVIRHDHVVALHDRRQTATEIAFTSEQAVSRMVRRICERARDPLKPNEVFVERRLERGGRMFGVLPPASGDAHMLVFRKPKRAVHSLEDLVRSGAISRAIATLLNHAVASRANILVTGAVNSGATHVLGALAGAGGIDDRVIVLQEDDELVFNQPHTVSILIGDTAEEGAKAVRAAIRVRPDRLVVGAFAGHVVAEVVDAVGDGVDGVLAAAHAPTLRHLCQRAPADLAATRGLASVDTAREWLAAAFDLVVEVARLRDGRHRVMRVSEFALGQGGRELGLRDIFTFTVDRTAAGGAIEGSFHPTGEVPRLAEDLARGTPLDSSIFKRTTR